MIFHGYSFEMKKKVEAIVNLEASLLSSKMINYIINYSIWFIDTRELHTCITILGGSVFIHD